MLAFALPNVQVLDLAKSYHEAAEILDAARSNAIPIINLRCHAIELFLKSLIIKNNATDLGDGVYLLRPHSGRGHGHELEDAFNAAFKDHKTKLQDGLPSLVSDLKALRGTFMNSRYLYEKGSDADLDYDVAAKVCRYFAQSVPQLPRVVDPDDLV